MGRTLLLSASVLALFCCEAAQAQSNSTKGGVEEVVVTAERRTQDLQKTPISASVLTGQDLQNKGVVLIDALQFSMPSVAVDNFGQGAEFNVRGIGKGEHNTQTSTGVITYRDGVPTFPGYALEEPYYDVASVEVLRGPQGTFAGMNATGGAVFVNTNNPDIDGGYNGYIMGNVGNYGEYGAQGAVNIPLTDTLAARAAFFGDSRDSFYHIAGPGGTHYDGNKGDQRLAAGRLSLLWEPTANLSVLFKADLDYLDMGAYPADPYYNRFKVFPGTAIPNPGYTDLFHIGANSPQAAIDRFQRYTMKIDYKFAGGITLQSMSSYQTVSSDYVADLDGTNTASSYFADSVDVRLATQELDLISPDTGFMTWIVGGYAQSLDYIFRSPYKFIIGTPLGSPFTEYLLEGTNPTMAYAGFGQVSFNLADGLQIQLGGRYTSTSTKNDGDVVQYGLPIKYVQKQSYHNFSYKAAVNWTVNDDNFLYGFVATGFKPGGLNVPVGLGNPAPFDSETVTDYEAGWKSTLWGGHVRTTLDGFYNDYKNFQVTVGYPLIPTFGFELNVPNTTKIYGFEGEADAAFGALSFNLGISWMHSDLGTFFATDSRIPSVLPCDPKAGPASVTCINLGGKQQTYAPNFTFNVGAQYVFDLGEGNTLTPRVSYGHVGPQWATLFENPDLGDRLAARNILGAQLEWARNSWAVTLYGTNLTDQHYVGALNSGLDFAGAPRQYGIRLTKTF